MHANNGGSTNSAAKQQACRTDEKARDEFGGTRQRKAPRNTRKIERPGRTWTTAEAAKGSGESERPWTKERPETPRSERTRRSRQSGHAPAAASGEQPIAGGWIGGAAAEFVGRMPLCCRPLRNAERTRWAGLWAGVGERTASRLLLHMNNGSHPWRLLVS